MISPGTGFNFSQKLNLFCEIIFFCFRYRDDYDDDKGMESSFAQQMREESLSKKIGLMEDLEDMKQEELAKKRKMIMKKRQKL